MLSDKIKLEILDKTRFYLKTNNVSQVDLGKQIGCNTAYISLMIKNNSLKTPNGVVFEDKYFLGMANIIGYQIEVQNEAHLDSINYRMIYSAVGYAHRNRERVLIDGMTGMGKTYALEKYSKENLLTIYLKCTTSMSAKDMLSEILAYIDPEKAKSLKKERQIILELSDLLVKKPYLLIIDELEGVKKEAIFRSIKEVADFCERKCGIVLCGINLIKLFDKQAKKEKTPFMQIQRRFNSNKVDRLELSADEIELVCNQKGLTNKSAIKWFQCSVNEFDTFTMFLQQITVAVQKGKYASLAEIDSTILQRTFVK
jgi:NACalpha-BTF3-like transcription factor